MLKFRLGLLVLLATCGMVLVPTVGLAKQTSAQSLHKLVEFTGKGTKNSKGFHITSSPVQVAYSFSHCWHGANTFMVDLVRRGITKPVVSVYGVSAKKRVLAYPRPGTYRVSVNTTCRWYVAVWGK